MVRGPALFPNLSWQSHQFHHEIMISTIIMAINIMFLICITTIDLIVIMTNLSFALPPRLSPMSPKACPRFTPFASSLSNKIAVDILHNPHTNTLRRQCQMTPCIKWQDSWLLYHNFLRGSFFIELIAEMAM